jgi:hypothetical protein
MREPVSNVVLLVSLQHVVIPVHLHEFFSSSSSDFSLRHELVAFRVSVYRLTSAVCCLRSCTVSQQMEVMFTKPHECRLVSALLRRILCLVALVINCQWR